MVYRVLIGFIPMIFAALVLTGTIPLGGIVPAQEYRSSAVRAAEAKEAKESAKAGSEREAERIGRGEMPTPAGAFRMHAELQADIEKMERAGTFREEAPRPAGWKPRSGGWGPKED